MEIQTKVLPLGGIGDLYSIVAKEITDDSGVFHLHLNPECIIYKALWIKMNVENTSIIIDFLSSYGI